MIPPLTTVQMSQSKLAKLAFQALMGEVGREVADPEGTELVLTTNLILRKSTALGTSTRQATVKASRATQH
jgi:DNA-binding LacI/PurR family transcriptional regulator